MTVQTDLVYYVTLPNQLDCISAQLKDNKKDLIRCMEWISECEKIMLVMTKAFEQQKQELQDLQKNNHDHFYQELQHVQISLIQDIQFQFNLLAEMIEHNRIAHHQNQEACRPLWERLPYQRRTRLCQQYWQQRTRQDQFWRTVREREQWEIEAQ